MKTISSVKTEFEKDLPLKTLRSKVKSITGFDLRRMDRFTLAAMHTTYMLLKNTNLKGTVGLYGVANYFSVELLQSLIRTVEQKQDVRPFDFIISVGNAANFYVAKQFEISGPNLFLGSSHQAEELSSKLIQVDASLGLIDHAIALTWIESESSLECQAKLLSN